MITELLVCNFLHLLSPVVINVFINIVSMAKDPVCNMNIDEKTAKYTSEINGNKVYLCSSACKQQLEQNPSKYGYGGKSNTKSK